MSIYTEYSVAMDANVAVTLSCRVGCKALTTLLCGLFYQFQMASRGLDCIVTPEQQLHVNSLKPPPGNANRKPGGGNPF